MKKAIVVFVMASALGSFGHAYAEGPDSVEMKGMYDGSRNSSGLISYCVDKGFLKSDSIENAKKMVAYVSGVPVEIDKRDGDKSEANGRKGLVRVGEGQYKDLQTSAPQGVEVWCEQADEGLRKGLSSVGL
ncbi:hypothetical protein [Pseudomonas fluorescens]|uniref:hypothetical protein n=1 Tax=Pseudomonas TaxID=286 RepID=UPI003D027455